MANESGFALVWDLRRRFTFLPAAVVIYLVYINFTVYDLPLYANFKSMNYWRLAVILAQLKNRFGG